MDDKELEANGWFDNVVKNLTKKVENYLDWKDPDALANSQDLPF